MSTTDLPGSSLLADRYRLVERLGAGGMSVVWRGFDEVLGRQVAVKVLPPSTSADPAFRRRLRAEAQAAARLSHPNITNVYDYGEAITVDGEPVPYVVMELIDGESLAAVLARARRLPWQHAVRLAAEVAAALAAAHSRGIVHRDVTPANVMLTQTGAKVVDFGISALIGENDIDPDGSLLGTPAYLAPERLEGGQVSPATDVYAVGLLIYRTLIGQLPWDVGTTTALLRAHQYVEPDPLPSVEGLPHAVAVLVGRCLEKRPQDRPPSAELANVLAGIAMNAPSVARGYVPDWSDSSEDTTILPRQRSYPDVIHRDPASDQRHAEEDAEPPARNSRFAALRSGPVMMGAAATGPALRPAFEGNQAPSPGQPPAPPGKSGKGRNSRSQSHTRRVMVAAGTVLLLGAGTYGWSLVSNTTERSAAVTPQPSVVPATGACVVSYAVWTDANGKFTAQVTVANRADTALKDWTLWFLMPGDQVVSGNGKVPLTQTDNTVTVSSSGSLGPQKAVTMKISGRYQTSNTAPQIFMLNNETCETFVSSEPGEPAKQVEHLSNGDTRLSATPSGSTPIPGVSIDPSTGVIVITPTTSATTSPSPSTSTSTDNNAPPPQPGDTPTTTSDETLVETESATPSESPSTTAPTTLPTSECEPDLEDCSSDG